MSPGWVARLESWKGVILACPTPFEDSGRATRRASITALKGSSETTPDPFSSSQSFTVRSQLAEASQRPLGLKATLLTRRSCAIKVTQCAAWGSPVRGLASQRRTV